MKDLKAGDLLFLCTSSFCFLTPDRKDIRSNQFLEEGSFVIVLNPQSKKKYIYVTACGSSGWVHFTVLKKISS